MTVDPWNLNLEQAHNIRRNRHIEALQEQMGKILNLLDDREMSNREVEGVGENIGVENSS